MEDRQNPTWRLVRSLGHIDDAPRGEEPLAQSLCHDE
jgi:hypothetical protein